MEPVLREIDDDDKAAGLRTLDFPFQGQGTFTPVPAPAACGAGDTMVGWAVRYAAQ